MPIHNRHQIGKAPGHREIGDIRAPDLVGMIDINIPEQVRIYTVGFIRLAGAFVSGIHSPNVHAYHQTTHVLACG